MTLNTADKEPAAQIGFFEKWLTVWVALCIVAGIILGKWFPTLFSALAAMEIAKVNLPVAVLIWLMIIPMLMKIDFAAMRQVGDHWRGISVTLLSNWAIKPFTMAVLGWVFLGWLFRPLLPAEQIDSYIAGLILLGAAPCTAMVFVWSNLTRGDPAFTLSQVALNDAIMIVLFAPIVALLLGVSAITVPWETLLISVILFIVVPVIIAQFLRQALNGGDGRKLLAFTEAVQPLSITALLLTVILLFAFQGNQIVAQPTIIALLAVPIMMQTVFIFAFAYWLNKKLGEAHCIAGPSALIGASNFFELAVATAISLFGIESGAALATVVGVLIEVPVMLILVGIVNRTQHWYEHGLPSRTADQA
jgi:ACR3 family arsenite transporter